MALRISFTLDPELSERLDIFAKKQELERNEALLRLIESGLTQAERDGIIPPARERSFKEVAHLQKNIDVMIRAIEDLKKEVRVMHHLIDMNKDAAANKPSRLGFFKR